MKSDFDFLLNKLQGQIFIHEDEDGHLYVQDENGTLQPVIRTEDGNYALAPSNSGDEMEVAEHQLEDESQMAKEEDYIIPDKDVKANSYSQVIKL